MSFRCEICKKAQPARTAPNIIVTERRATSYQEIKDGNKTVDRGGRGWEIAKEIHICDKCNKARNEREKE